ncbi:MAG: serine/threonine protein kinase [Myxococcales bacterium]|nr:serine/threonine protein kinase [Myxococcales bacterium]
MTPNAPPPRDPGQPPATLVDETSPRAPSPREADSDALTLPPLDDPRSGPRVTAPESRPAPSSRYVAKATLGEGGMGVVSLSHDVHIGRDVAIKTIRPDRNAQPDLKARFLREARVQGRLEHPSIVPVYDLGTDETGAAYFAMKRVNGATLADIVELLSKGDHATAEKYSRHRLLGAFGSVCLAIDFAHERGVIHRDLKPGNVMIGDFGEVYVLDWGVAKVDDEADLQGSSDDVTGSRTRAGSYVGTLGYMSPEQLTGGAVGRAGDVFSLGAVLFELLTYAPLIQGDATQLRAQTLLGVDAQASTRAPHRAVPPALEAICVRATSKSALDRFATTREMYEALQHYLDGDQERERRRELSQQYARAASPRAELALADQDPSNEAREQAMRDVGNALALDAKNLTALRTMTRLMVHPPRKTPPDAAAAMEQSRLALMRVTARIGAFAFGSWFAWLPLLVWMGLRSPLTVAFISAALGGALVLCLVEQRESATPKDAMSAGIVALGLAGLAALTRLFGPLVLIPTAAFGFAITFGLNHFRPRLGVVAFAASLAVVFVPTALEYAGVLPPSYSFEGGRLQVLPQIAQFPAEATLLMLCVANLLLISAIWWLTRRVQRALADAETRVAIQAWHLRLMVPEEARHAVRAPTVRSGRVTLEKLPVDP